MSLNQEPIDQAFELLPIKSSTGNLRPAVTNRVLLWGGQCRSRLGDRTGTGSRLARPRRLTLLCPLVSARSSAFWPSWSRPISWSHPRLRTRATPMTLKTTPADLRRLLTLADATAILNCSVKTLRCRIAAGELPAVRDGRMVRIHPDDLRRFVQGRRS
jgi:excisionase family DNA binding protein